MKTKITENRMKTMKVMSNTFFRKSFLALSILVLAFSSCSKDEEETPTTPPTATTDVYVCGSTRNLARDQVPTLWKNGIPTILPSPSGVQTIASKVVVSGNDVYAINQENNEIGKILLWKNGVLVQTIDNAYPIDLKVDNNDVYILGKFENTHKIWKNGVETILTNNGVTNWVRHMIISSGNVFVAGAESSGTKTVAKLWKNGVAISISNPANSAFVNGFDVVGNDVAVLLREITPSGSVTLKTWKNNVLNTLETSIFNDFTFGSGVLKISGADLLVAAKVPINNSSDKILFWRNNNKTVIALNGASMMLFDMKVKENDVHILYNEKNPGETGKFVLKHSKNGQIATLTTDTEESVFDTAISLSNNGKAHIAGLGKYFVDNTSAILQGTGSKAFNIFTVN
jgi:hypothetical protein